MSVGAATLAAFRREQPFGWQDQAVRQLAEMDERYTRVLAARDFASPPDDPACACRLYTHDGLGQVDEVGTLEARRRRGHARAAVAAAADAAAADGCERVFMVTDAADWPQELYRSLGFDEIGATYEFLKLPVSLTAIIVTVDLLPCIVQDARTGEVLTLAYMNDEALRAHARDRRDVVLVALAQRALAQGRDLRERPAAQGAALDCDDGRASSRSSSRPARRATPGSAPASTRASSTRCRRRRSRCSSARSRSAAGRTPTRAACWPTPSWSGRRSQEEAEEVVRAAREESDERLAEEAADVLYHLAVLLAARGLQLADVYEVLNGRRRLTSS